MKALLVDDHSLVRHGLDMLLTMQLNFKQVMHAESADAAIAHLDTGVKLDLVLLDYMLGGNNGLALLAQIKSRQPELPVVIMSSEESVESVIQALGEGAAGFVPKTLDPKELAAALDRVIAGDIFVPELQELKGGRRLQQAIRQAEESRLSQLAEVARRVIRDRNPNLRKGAAEAETASAFNRLLDELELDRSRLQEMAFHDGLTGLANRRLFIERAESGLKQAKRRKAFLALAYINLDRFTQLNETLGHDAGDEVLMEVARRLRATVREVDTVARLGGDEFTLVLVDVSKPDMERLVQELFRVVTEEIHLGAGESWKPQISLGIAFSDGHEDLQTLLSRADNAVHRVKRKGKNQYLIDFGSNK